jgi:hypothetical protein
MKQNRKLFVEKIPMNNFYMCTNAKTQEVIGNRYQRLAAI